MGRLPTKAPELKSKPINTGDIETAVARMFDVRRHIIVPNVSYGFHNGHEKDIFIITASGYGKEVEIKISVSDFRADFKKGHQHKSKYVKEFYYAFPKDLYEKIKDEVPEHAGIILCDRYGSSGRVYATIIRKAKINSESIKLTDADLITIGKLASMRIWSLKENIKSQKNHIAELKIEINKLKNDTKV